MDDMNIILSLVIGCGSLALVYGVYMATRIIAAPAGNDKMQKIAAAIQEGASAYLNRQYSAIALVGGIITVLLFLSLGFYVSLGFLIGAILSGVAGYIGIHISVRANVRTTEACRKGLKEGLDIAFKSGAVTGLLVVGLGLCGVTGYYMYLKESSLLPRDILEALVALSFGASLISIFARLGGGIFTKGADVGADLVGKLEAGIPEDDPRNPATIADNVGDNVGDCAGMAADLFETYAVTIVATMLLGSIFFGGAAKELMMVYPLAVGGVCIISSILGMFFVRLKSDSTNVMGALYRGLAATIVFSLVGIYLFTNQYFDEKVIYDVGTVFFSSTNLFLCATSGLVITGLIVWVTQYYTSTQYRPVRSIAKASTTGHGTNVIQGLAVSMEATAIPIIIICTGIIFSYMNAGLYGISIAATSMLATAGIIVALDAYGPVTDNADGIAKMAELPEKARKTTEALDAVGNSTKAVTKGYAIGSAALASLVLFATYTENLKHYFPDLNVKFLLSDPYIVVGLLTGGMLPYLFGAISIMAVGRVAGSVVIEVRRQVKTIKGLMEGKAKPEYGKAADLLTKAAIKEMIIPALLPIAAPIVLYYVINSIAGQEAAFASLGAMLLGIIVTGIFVALSMTAGGGAWNNAKKYIEDGNHGGKGSDAHKAAITGDTVGAPYKDTAGPAINPMIKIANIVALLLLAILAN